ncbi:hypothetical protein LSH36_586g01077 [Paralvinella palmiformis]|uniref:Major facilitator superfamily (MFS) profile domain-containing protein n=1 Tax=Paralvinella palmiformis TaxID=53620 RepID=A0AAD9J5C8_9ANNE|nr:hypothetical protein LSH36_586g01077 [Paralvinella palmiformis]
MAISRSKGYQITTNIPETGVPDGGWGWVIVCCSFVNHLLLEGYIRSFGLIYLQILDRYHANPVAITWIHASFNVIQQLGIGPFLGFLVKRFTCRKLAICGGFTFSIAFLMTAFSPSIYVMYFTYSVVGGLGSGLIYLPIVIIVQDYFDKKRGKAMGLAALGAATGTFIMPMVISVLFREYGFIGCLMIMAAIGLNHCFVASFYRPLPLNAICDTAVAVPTPKDEQANVRNNGEGATGKTVVNYDNPNYQEDDSTQNSTSDEPMDNNGGISVTKCEMEDKNEIVTFASSDGCGEREDGLSNGGMPQRDTETGSQIIPENESNKINRRFSEKELISAEKVRINTMSDGELTSLESKVNLHTIQNESKTMKISQDVGMEMSGCFREGIEQESGVQQTYDITNKNIQLRKRFEANNENKSLCNDRAADDAISNYKTPTSGSRKSAETAKLRLAKKIKPNLSIFKNLSFVLYGFLLFTIPSANTATFTFLPGLAKENGIPSIKSATLISIIGAANAVGTLAIGFLFDVPLVRRHRRMFHSILGVLLGVSQLVVANTRSFVAMSAVGCWYGIALAGVMGQRATALSQYVSSTQVPTALGYMTMFQGLGNLVGLTLQGFLKDVSGTYSTCFYYGGSVVTLSSTLLSCEYIISKNTSRKDDRNQELPTTGCANPSVL